MKAYLSSYSSYIILAALVLLCLTLPSCDTAKAKEALQVQIDRTQQVITINDAKIADLEISLALLDETTDAYKGIAKDIEFVKDSQKALVESVHLMELGKEKLEASPTMEGAVHTIGSTILPFVPPGYQQLLTYALGIFSVVQTVREKKRAGERNAVIRNNDLARDGNGSIVIKKLADLNDAAGISTVVRNIRKPAVK